ncbi:MAG: hypothetical protein JKY56_18685 [Kofleriaceae bacterium]|nr:hypothetical protein [Kofleriaceae bacterium]
MFIALVVAAGAVALASLFFSRNARIIRSLRTTPQRRIESFSEEEVAKIVGTLQYIGDPLISPLTGRHCAYYEIHVDEHYGGNNAQWHTMIRESVGVEFEVDDGTGKAVVDPMSAMIAIVVDSHTRSGTLDSPTGREVAYLESHQRKSKGWFLNKKIRYREGILESGELVAIMGRGTRETDIAAGSQGERGYRDAPAMRLRMQSPEKTPMKISDNPSAR